MRHTNNIKEIKPAAPNAAIASLFGAGRIWRVVGYRPERDTEGEDD